MRVSAIVSVIFAALCIIPGAAGEKEPAGDLAALQGKWKVWYEKSDYIILEIKGKAFSMTRTTAAGQGPTARGSFTIDEKANPKEMTWMDVAGGGLNLPVNRCIYELHGDTWLLIGGVDKRPEHFYSGEGKPHKAWILKREKRDK